jgi:endonuclease/exonuclease/phosphatase family metal-dependent hydrolase
VRLATWNVLHARSPEDGRVDLDRYTAAVAELDVDVLALQEVDRAQPRSHRADLPGLAARALGATHHRFVPSMVAEPGFWSFVAAEAVRDSGWVIGADAAIEPAVDPAAPTYGVALLSRYPVTAWRVVRLPPARVALPLLLGRPLRPVLVPDEPRVALAARVCAPWGSLTVVSTHLSFVPGWNLVQLRRVVAALSEVSRDPLVLLGDLNAGAWAARAVSGLTGLAAGATFPAWSPVVQLDHVLGRGVTVQDARVHHLPVSDHRAVSVTVR